MPVAPFGPSTLAAGGSGRDSRSIGTSVTSINIPAGYNFLKVLNKSTTAYLTLALDADPSNSSGSLPGIAFGNGEDLAPGADERFTLDGNAHVLHIQSDTASTPIILNVKP